MLFYCIRPSFIPLNSSQVGSWDIFLCSSLNEVGEDLVEVLESLELGKAAYVFIPVNNHIGHESVGGSHWYVLKAYSSLLS
jgi:hypothetical protein